MTTNSTFNQKSKIETRSPMFRQDIVCFAMQARQYFEKRPKTRFSGRTNSRIEAIIQRISHRVFDDDTCMFMQWVFDEFGPNVLSRSQRRRFRKTFNWILTESEMTRIMDVMLPEALNQKHQHIEQERQNTERNNILRELYNHVFTVIYNKTKTFEECVYIFKAESDEFRSNIRTKVEDAKIDAKFARLANYLRRTTRTNKTYDECLDEVKSMKQRDRWELKAEMKGETRVGNPH